MTQEARPTELGGGKEENTSTLVFSWKEIIKRKEVLY